MAGLLTEAIDWRAIFAFDAAVRRRPGRGRPGAVDNRPVGEPEPFDYRGLAVLHGRPLRAAGGADAGAHLGLGRAPPRCCSSPPARVTLAGFVRLELRTEYPLLDVGLLRPPRPTPASSWRCSRAQVVVTGFIIYGATYFQHVLGLGPLLASLALASSMFAEPLFNILAGRVTDRSALVSRPSSATCSPPRPFAWIAAFADNDSYLLLLPGLLVLNASIAPMFTSLLTGLSNAVSAEERGDANALVLTVRWIGAAAGTMVLGVVILLRRRHRVTEPSPYAAAFAILSGTALLGALACATLLRGR